MSEYQNKTGQTMFTLLKHVISHCYPPSMILLYRFIFLPALVIALPYYLFRMWRRGGYGKSFEHRFGRFRRLDAPESGTTRIWLQAVSVGEVLAVGPLIEHLQKSNHVEIVLTTTTSTAYAEARKRYANQVLSVGVFPLDFWLFSRLAWKRIQPDAIILTESELWPEHLHQAKQRQVPAYLVNARISDTSFRRYQKLGTLAGRLLTKFSAIYAASEHDAERFVKLGAAPAATHCYGSIKMDAPLPEALDQQSRDALLREFGFATITDQQPFILLGSSTWPGEERLLIEITSRLQSEGQDVRFLLVPRHAERGPEIRRLLQKQPLAWHQRSSGAPANGDVMIYLADTTGELSRLSQIADLAFIGKSLPPNDGGQTPIDAAGLGIPLLVGPNMTNFKLIVTSLRQEKAARLVTDGASLEQAIRELLADPTTRQAMSQAGADWHTRNRGSSQRIAESILVDLKR